jgi:hypothetical protein
LTEYDFPLLRKIFAGAIEHGHMISMSVSDVILVLRASQPKKFKQRPEMHQD